MNLFKPCSQEDIREIVLENDQALQKSTLKELYDFAVEEGFDSALEFSRYKRALKEIGVDYDELRDECVTGAWDK